MTPTSTNPLKPKSIQDELTDISLAFGSLKRKEPPINIALLVRRAKTATDMAFTERKRISWIQAHTKMGREQIWRIIRAVDDLADVSIQNLKFAPHGMKTILDLAKKPAKDQIAFWDWYHMHGYDSNVGRALERFAPRVSDDHQDEIPFMNELMISLQAHFKKDIYIERRNVGGVVKRDHSGKAIGYFKASNVNGAADFFGVLRPFGIHFEIETKAEKGSMRADQVNFAERMGDLGVVYLTIHYDDSKTMAENLTVAIERMAEAFQSAERRIVEWASTIAKAPRLA